MLICYNPYTPDSYAATTGYTWSNLTNIMTQRLGQRAICTGPVSNEASIDIELTDVGAATVPVKCIALVGHNLTATAEMKIIGANNATFLSIAYDSGYVPARTITAAETGKYPGLAYIASETTLATCRFWRVIIKDADLIAAGGQIQIGYLNISDGWVPATGPSFGWSLAYEDTSIIETSMGGIDFFDKRPKYRVLRFGVDYMDSDEWISDGMSMARDRGLTEPVLVLMSTSDANLGERVSFLGRLRTLNPIENPDPVRYASAFEVKEWIG